MVRPRSPWRRLSFRRALLLFFIPATILSVSLTALASYTAAVQVVSERSRVLMGETVRQSAALVDSSLRTLLGQLVALRYDPAFLGILEGELSPVTDAERYEEIIALNARFQDVVSAYPAIDSIYAKLASGREFSVIPNATPSAIGTDLARWMTLRVNRGGLGWLGPHDDTIFQTSDRRRVVTMALRIGGPSTKLQAILLFNLKEELFRDLFQGVTIGDHGYLVLVDEAGVPWYPTEAASALALTTESARDLARGPAATPVKAVGGAPLVTASVPLALVGWTLVAVVPQSDFSGPMNRIAWISLAIMGVLIGLTSVAAVVFSRSVTSSLLYLSRQSARFVAGDLEVPFFIGDANEIGDLSRDLATMAGSVRALLAQTKDDQEKKRALELAVLQNQIQPHFVANTLASVRHLVQLGDARRADQMLGALGRYFHNGLAGGQALVPLSQEWDHSLDYLTIQKLRYADDFDFVLDPLPAEADVLVPKIIVQPLVENALYHGIKGSGGYGTIAVGITVTDELLEVAVQDDGVGMPPDRLAAVNQALGDAVALGGPFFGLRNVHQRLVLHFGPRAGLVITPAEPRGTVVLVRIPRTGAPR